VAESAAIRRGQAAGETRFARPATTEARLWPAEVVVPSRDSVGLPRHGEGFLASNLDQNMAWVRGFTGADGVARAGTTQRVSNALSIGRRDAFREDLRDVVYNRVRDDARMLDAVRRSAGMERGTVAGSLARTAITLGIQSRLREAARTRSLTGTHRLAYEEMVGLAPRGRPNVDNPPNLFALEGRRTIRAAVNGMGYDGLASQLAAARGSGQRLYANPTSREVANATLWKLKRDLKNPQYRGEQFRALARNIITTIALWQ
jgi:hypothetical protein